MTLQALAVEAADHWGAMPLALIRNRENAVFQVALPGGALGALRLHRVGYQAKAAIRSELWWCGALADAGLAVPRPVATANGETIVTTGAGRFASVIAWLPGVPLGEAGVPLSDPPEVLARRHHALGYLLAQIHATTDALALPQDFIRPAWDIDGLVGEAPFWGRFWDHPALQPSEAALLSAARDHLRGILGGWAHTTPLGPIHADVLRENVLVSGEAVSVIDFDDSGIGFRLYDLGTVLSQNLYEPFYADIRAALIEGYGSLRPVEPDMVDAFTLARCLASVGWAMPRLAPDDPTHGSHIARAVMMARRILA